MDNMNLFGKDENTFELVIKNLNMEDVNKCTTGEQLWNLIVAKKYNNKVDLSFSDTTRVFNQLPDNMKIGTHFQDPYWIYERVYACLQKYPDWFYHKTLSREEAIEDWKEQMEYKMNEIKSLKRQ